MRSYYLDDRRHYLWQPALGRGLDRDRLFVAGVGRYATASAISLDFPAVMGVTLLAALVYVLAILASMLAIASWIRASNMVDLSSPLIWRAIGLSSVREKSPPF